jgi:hypothetical protein
VYRPTPQRNKHAMSTQPTTPPGSPEEDMPLMKWCTKCDAWYIRMNWRCGLLSDEFYRWVERDCKTTCTCDVPVVCDDGAGADAAEPECAWSVHNEFQYAPDRCLNGTCTHQTLNTDMDVSVLVPGRPPMVDDERDILRHCVDLPPTRIRLCAEVVHHAAQRRRVPDRVTYSNIWALAAASVLNMPCLARAFGVTFRPIPGGSPKIHEIFEAVYDHEPTSPDHLVHALVDAFDHIHLNKDVAQPDAVLFEKAMVLFNALTSVAFTAAYFSQEGVYAPDLIKAHESSADIWFTDLARYIHSHHGPLLSPVLCDTIGERGNKDVTRLFSTRPPIYATPKWYLILCESPSWGHSVVDDRYRYLAEYVERELEAGNKWPL